jgi:hypothetical protein
MDEQEKQEIIDLAVEKSLLMIPEVVGNLMTQMVTYQKLNSKFYKRYPEFKDKEDVVASVVEMIDGQNPTIEYNEILKKAVPKIRERIQMTKGLSTTTVTVEPNRDFSNGEV